MQIIQYNFNSSPGGSKKGVFSKLLFLFIAIPVIEMYLLIKVGQYLGPLNTILLVIMTGILGSILMKLEGLRVWSQFQKCLMQMQMPKDGILDGILILIGGVVLITPGILTDIVGLLLLIPPTRHLVRDRIKKRIENNFSTQSKKKDDSVIDV